MGAETILVVLLVWAVVGLITAIAFGKAIQQSDTSPHEAGPLPSSLETVKFFRKTKRKPSSEQVHHHKVRTRVNSAVSTDG